MQTRPQPEFSIACFDGTDAAARAAAESMTGLVTFDVFEVDKPAKHSATGPDWIKLAPRGRFTTRDGRNLEVDPEALVRRFDAEKIAVAVDKDHATVKKAVFGGDAPAVGWIEELQARDDGLYARVDWLDEGVRVITARTHRYISPALKPDELGKALWLHSAALVATPAISMPALASADHETREEETMNKVIAHALDLADDAGETACLNAITALKTNVAKDVHERTLEALDAKSKELETLQGTIRKDKVDALLEDALKAKKIVPAERAEYETLCATDAGLSTVTKLLAAKSPALGKSGLDDRDPPDETKTLSAEDREIMKQLGVTEEEYRKANGLTAA